MFLVTPEARRYERSRYLAGALSRRRRLPDGWICVVWATRRCAESYRLVWAVTVVRPRCSGTATARTDPLLTGRKSWLVEVIVAVVAPSGSPRNVTSAPAVS